MNTRTPWLLLAALPLLTGPSIPVASAEDPPARSFEWLTGRWCSQEGKTLSFEFMRIESRDGITSYVAVVAGQPATSFRLTSFGPDRVRFENPQHDFPTRVEYRRTADGLYAEIGGPGKNGKETVILVQYRRCAD